MNIGAALPFILIICALGVTFTKNLLAAIIIFTVYSLIMAVLWMCLQAPDLAITEAAVGAGVTSILFFLVHRRIIKIKQDKSRKAGEINA